MHARASAEWASRRDEQDRIAALEAKRRAVERARDLEMSRKEAERAHAANQHLQKRDDVIRTAKETKAEALKSVARAKQEGALLRRKQRSDLEERRDANIRAREKARELRELERIRQEKVATA